MKKTMLTLATLLIVLATMGFNCINDTFDVAVNLPIEATFTINSGPAGNFGGTPVTVVLSGVIDQSYIGKIKNVRSYDIRVSTIGTCADSIANGYGTINGKQILTFRGQWNSFNTPQSVLGSSPYVTPNPVGVTELLNTLTRFMNNSSTTAVLNGGGTLIGPSVRSGLQMKVQIFAQVDAELSGS